MDLLLVRKVSLDYITIMEVEVVATVKIFPLWKFIRYV